MINIKNMLVPTDLSDHAGYALSYARELASLCGASLHLLYVIELHWFDEEAELPEEIAHALPQYQRDKQLRLDAVKIEIEGEGLEVKVRVDAGAPHAAIIRYARGHDIDLIVLATHGRSGLAHALSCSVAEKVVQMAPCPVLTVKHPARIRAAVGGIQRAEMPPTELGAETSAGVSDLRRCGIQRSREDRQSPTDRCGRKP